MLEFEKMTVLKLLMILVEKIFLMLLLLNLIIAVQGLLLQGWGRRASRFFLSGLEMLILLLDQQL